MSEIRYHYLVVVPNYFGFGRDPFEAFRNIRSRGYNFWEGDKARVVYAHSRASEIVVNGIDGGLSAPKDLDIDLDKVVSTETAKAIFEAIAKAEGAVEVALEAEGIEE